MSIVTLSSKAPFKSYSTLNQGVTINIERDSELLNYLPEIPARTGSRNDTEGTPNASFSILIDTKNPSVNRMIQYRVRYGEGGATHFPIYLPAGSRLVCAGLATVMIRELPVRSDEVKDAIAAALQKLEEQVLREVALEKWRDTVVNSKQLTDRIREIVQAETGRAGGGT